MAGVLSLVLGVLACNMPALRFGSAPAPRLTSTPIPPPATPVTPMPTPVPTPFPDPAWEELQPGLELRREYLSVQGVSVPAELIVVRVDPAYFELRVHYDPGHIATVSEWQARTGAVFLVNGGFFLPSKETLGLIVADGQRYGQSFDRHGGMLSVSDGIISVRSLAQFPYLEGEALEQAVQGRPMLLYPGRFPVQFDLSDELSRRTAVGQDGQGRLIFVVHDGGILSLYDLRDWMAGNEAVGLWTAFNLDGGGSTGLALAAGERSLLIDSWYRVPSVIALYPRP